MTAGITQDNAGHTSGSGVGLHKYAPQSCPLCNSFLLLAASPPEPLKVDLISQAASPGRLSPGRLSLAKHVAQTGCRVSLSGAVSQIRGSWESLESLVENAKSQTPPMESPGRNPRIQIFT